MQRSRRPSGLDSRRRPRRLVASLVLLAVGSIPEPPARAETTPLTVAATLENRLKADSVHTYRVELGSGPYRLLLTQHGGDAVVTVIRPDGERLGPFNSPAGRRGPEAVLVVAERSAEVPGTQAFVFEIRPRSSSSAGRYTLMLERLAEPVVPAETAATAAALAYAAGDKAKAQKLYRDALALWPQEDAAGRARTLVALANLGRVLGDPREAAELYRRALPLWRRLGDKESEATTRNRLGLTLDRLGESLAAQKLFEETLALWQELGDGDAEGPARVNLCLVRQRQGELADARTCYEEARAFFHHRGDTDRETVVLSNLAGVHWKLGEPDRALALYAEVLERSRAENDSRQEGRTLSNRAQLLVELGEAEDALRDLHRALEIFRRGGDRRMEGTVLATLGRTYLGLGEPERAQSVLEQALSLHRDAGNRRGTASVLRTLGQARRHLEDWHAAFEAYGEALATSLELDDRRGEATVRQLLGEAHAAEGSLRRAAPELGRAAELQRGLGDRRQEAQALLELAKVRHGMGEASEVFRLFDGALAIFRRVRDPGEEARTLEARARTLHDLGRISEALADATAAGALLEELRARAGGLRQRSTFLAARRGVYELHIELLMAHHRADPAAGYDRQAFAVSEGARSRMLLDILGEGTGLDTTARRHLRDAARRLAGRAELQMALLAGEHDEAEAEAADRDVYDALAELERRRAELRRDSPGYAELTRHETLDVAGAQKLLDDETLLLEFVLGERRSFAWALSADAFTSFELPPRREIEALARTAHADLATLDLRTGRTSREARTRLGALLLAPVASRLRTARRLVVVPDGALHYLPFAAFPDPDGEALLVARHDVVHLPSASVLAAVRRRTPSTAGSSKTIAVLADPVFSPRDPRLAAHPADSAKHIDTNTHTETPNAVEPARLRGDLASLDRLPATRREAAAITALVPPSESLVASGFGAHRGRVVGGELAGYRYLHFATHGLLNAHHPELSGLVLSRLDGGGRPRGGFLSTADVYSLELGAELVVLSGCQTALGREIRGEGLVGLTRAFMAAGVPRVVASLWPVRDDATAELMTRFYRAMLDDGQPPAAALATAQRSISKERRWADPYFWAAFVLEGDWL